MTDSGVRILPQRHLQSTSWREILARKHSGDVHFCCCRKISPGVTDGTERKGGFDKQPQPQRRYHEQADQLAKCCSQYFPSQSYHSGMVLHFPMRKLRHLERFSNLLKFKHFIQKDFGKHLDRRLI